jgi:drug/metabolite transporter (DMT)-like permease
VGVVYGLLAAVGWGGADFLGTVSTRRVGVARTLWVMCVTGTLGLVLLAPFTGQSVPALSRWWLAAVGLAFGNVAGMLLLYRSFAVGTLSIVSPIASSYTVVMGVLAFASGERLPGLTLAGTGMLVAGVLFVARGSRSGAVAGLAGVREAGAAALAMGVTFWALSDVAAELGWLWTVLVLRLVQLACLSGFLALSPSPRTGSIERQLLPLLVVAGLLDTTGLAALNLGLTHAYATTTGALSSLYAAVAIVLAWLFLRERLSPLQWSGIAAIFAGILMVSL